MLDYCNLQLSEATRAKPDDKTKEELKQLLKNSTNLLKTQQRDERQAKVAQDKIDAVRKAVQDAVKSRGVNFRGSLYETNHGAAVHGHYVHLDTAQSLVWPVVFIYPETGETDFIKEFSEGSNFIDLFKIMFESPPEWDPEGRFKPDKLRVWYHSYEDEQYSGLILKEFDSRLSLGEALQLKGYVVTNAVPTFVVGLEEPKY